jgi:AcrR family transcriptional regulator
MKRRRSSKPVSRDPAIVGARILDAAQAEFMVHGYAAASTNRIRLAFGGSKATLFRHFPTKLQLLEAVIQRIATDWRRSIDWPDATGAVPSEWLTLVGERMLVWFVGAGPLFVGRLAIAEGRKLPRLKLIFQRAAGRPLRAALARQFREWKRRELLEIADPQRDAVHFLDLLISGEVSRRLYGGAAMRRPQMKHHVARCVALFLGGCGK